MKKLGSIVILFSLAGCGGASNVQQASYNVNKIFADSAGVFTGTTETGERAVGISPGVVDVVNAANNSESESIDIDIANFPVVDTYPQGVVRSGAISTGTFAANVTIFIDSTEAADLIYMGIPGQSNLLMATVEDYTAPTGSYSYTGLFAAAGRTVSPLVEYGTFTMEADFSANSVSFNGQTASYGLTGSAVLDANAGTFNSNTFRFEDADYYYDASIYGLMGGSGATATSGVFHTNDQSVDYSGAFLGHR